METFLSKKEEKKPNYLVYGLGALIGAALIGLAVWLSIGPSMEEQMANILEGSYREGSPEFERLTKDIIISTDDDTVESPNAFGSISMYIKGKIRNKGSHVINGLEVNVAVVDQFNEVLKERRILVVPTQVPQLGPGDVIPIHLEIAGFNAKDDRANIRWKVTAIRTKN